MRRNLIIILVCVCGATRVAAQTPTMLRHVTRLAVQGTPLDGAHRVTVRWYDAPSGGSPVLTEVHDVNAVLGVVELRLGETVGLADTLLRRGSAWLGYTVDNETEDPVRERLLGAPYARMAERAAVAERLAQEITGVVTSVNEIAGAVRIEGDSSIDVRREGSVLHLRGRAQHASLEHGVLQGTNDAWRFRLRLATPLDRVVGVTLHVESNTEQVIGASVVERDTVSNEIVIATTTVLRTDERLHWTIHVR